MMNIFEMSETQKNIIKEFNDTRITELKSFVDNTHLFEVFLQDSDQVKN